MKVLDHWLESRDVAVVVVLDDCDTEHRVTFYRNGSAKDQGITPDENAPASIVKYARAIARTLFAQWDHELGPDSGKKKGGIQ